MELPWWRWRRYGRLHSRVCVHWRRFQQTRGDSANANAKKQIRDGQRVHRHSRTWYHQCKHKIIVQFLLFCCRRSRNCTHSMWTLRRGNFLVNCVLRHTCEHFFQAGQSLFCLELVFLKSERRRDKLAFSSDRSAIFQKYMQIKHWIHSPIPCPVTGYRASQFQTCAFWCVGFMRYIKQNRVSKCFSTCVILFSTSIGTIYRFVRSLHPAVFVPCFDVFLFAHHQKNPFWYFGVDCVSQCFVRNDIITDNFMQWTLQNSNSKHVRQSFLRNENTQWYENSHSHHC